MKKNLIIILFTFLGIQAFSQENIIELHGLHTSNVHMNQIDFGNMMSFNISSIQADNFDKQFDAHDSRNHQTQDNHAFTEAFSHISIYPNKELQSIHLYVKNIQPISLSYQLTDTSSKVLSFQNIDESETMIDLQKYAYGKYHLKIIDPYANTIKKFKIIKKP